MCGIVGLAGKGITMKHERVFRTLLILDTVRGEHSTGIYQLSKDKKSDSLVKVVGDPFQLFDNRGYTEALKGAHSVLLGHNRYATSGKITRGNAHPFEVGDLVGVHNGTLNNKWVLDDAKDFDVDSENLYHQINKDGVKDAVGKVTGAWALVWVNKKEETLNFLRNTERPLYFTTTPEDDVTFWASERWMLEIALGRHEVKHTEISMFKPDVHYKIDIGEKGALGNLKMQTVKGSTFRTSSKNVTQFPAKKNTAALPPEKVKDAEKTLDFEYIKQRNLTFAIESYVPGGVGYNPYFILKDYMYPDRQIRMYDCGPVKEMGFLIGERVIADVASFNPQNFSYAVSLASVKLAFPRKDKKKDKEPRRYGMTEKEFMDKHGICDCCGRALNFHDNNLIEAGYAYCPTCCVTTNLH